MRSLFNTPLEDMAHRWWSGIDGACRKAFLIAIGVSVLAFGFEMTNLTLNHDDVWQLLIQDTILNHYLGRFAFGWLYVYTQNHYVMPFLQLAAGIVVMSAYGVVIARFWGLRKTTDIALIAAIVCVFPYMAQTYSYNTSEATYTVAHLFAALAVVFSVRATFKSVAIAALFYLGAFSIYQAVAANGAAIFVSWLVCQLVFAREREALVFKDLGRASIGALSAAVVGGLIYLACVSQMHIEFDSSQAAETAFRLGGATHFSQSIPEVWSGTRSFFLWPERYFPDYLKYIQLAFLAGAAMCCVWVPTRPLLKIAALALLVLSAFTPRALQLLHPDGTYHAVTLTAYAVVVAGALMIILRADRTFVRNVALVAAVVLVWGYSLQDSWISTVNYLNTIAHFETLNQVLARVRGVPDASWDGKRIVVVGRYDMPVDYPFRPQHAVASRFMDAKHMDDMARLIRDEATFVAADKTMPKVLEYARTHAPWPSPGSVTVMDGMGVVVFSKDAAPAQQ